MEKSTLIFLMVVCILNLTACMKKETIQGIENVEQVVSKQTDETDSDNYKYIYLKMEENDDRFEYDEFGNKTKWIQGEKIIEYKNTYDDIGRLKMTYYELGKDQSTTYEYLYDSKGYKIREEMSNYNGMMSSFTSGYETTFINDESGRPIQCDMKTVTNGKVDEGITTTILQYTEDGILSSLKRYYSNGDVEYEEYNEYGDIITETIYKNGNFYSKEKIKYIYEFDKDNNIIKKTSFFEDGLSFVDTYKWKKVKIKLPTICDVEEIDINQKSLDALSQYMQIKNINDDQLTYLGIYDMMNTSYYDYLFSEEWHILVQTVEPYNIYISEGYETEAILVWPEEETESKTDVQEQEPIITI